MGQRHLRVASGNWGQPLPLNYTYKKILKPGFFYKLG